MSIITGQSLWYRTVTHVTNFNRHWAVLVIQNCYPCVKMSIITGQSLLYITVTLVTKRLIWIHSVNANSAIVVFGTFVINLPLTARQHDIVMVTSLVLSAAISYCMAGVSCLLIVGIDFHV